MRSFVVAVLAVLLTSWTRGYGQQASENASTPKIEVEKIVVCSAIENKDPLDEITTTNSAYDRLYCWTKIKSVSVPVTIKHVWSVNGKKVAEIPLEVASSPYRTRSNKGVYVGKWKVDVVDESGQVLASKEFEIIK